MYKVKADIEYDPLWKEKSKDNMLKKIRSSRSSSLSR